jgi:hypothetical protein
MHYAFMASAFATTLSVSAAMMLGSLGLLKWWITLGGLMWLKRWGRLYKRTLQGYSSSKLTGKTIREIVGRCEGNSARPWGVLDYLLCQKSRLSQTFARWIFRVPIMCGAAAMIYLAFYSVNRKPWTAAIWTTVAIVYQIEIILIALEGICAYLAIGSYQKYYHLGIRLPDKETLDTRDEMSELNIFLPLFFCVVVVDGLAFLAAQSGLDAFKTELHVTNLIPQMFQAAYFVSTTMATVGYGDIIPKSTVGQIIAMLMHVQSFLLIVGLVSSFVAFGVRASNDKWRRRSKANMSDHDKS